MINNDENDKEEDDVIEETSNEPSDEALPEDDSENTENQNDVDDKKPSTKDKVVNLKEKAINKILWLISFSRNNFRPTLWTSISTAIIIVMLFGLSGWQIYKYDKMSVFLEKVERNKNKDREEMPPASMLGEAIQYDYRPVKATGEMMFLKTMNFMDKEHEGKDGYHVLTPLRLDNGEIILVNRGWVENGQKPNNTYWKTTDITISGTARIPEEKGIFTADNKPKENEWHWINLSAMAKSAGVIKFHPLIIEQDKMSDNDTDFPIAGQTIFDIPNNHYNYALSCFVLIFIFAVVWVVYSFQHGIFLNKELEEPVDVNDEKMDDDDASIEDEATDDNKTDKDIEDTDKPDDTSEDNVDDEETKN